MIIGGRSSEHEVSLMSGRAVSDHLNRAFYQVEHFLIDKKGEWYQYTQFPDCDVSHGRSLGANYEDLIDCDILFPVLHGSYGEDGTMQGFFEILGKAYVGCDHRSSANCMDKALTKTICQHRGIQTSKFIHFTHYDWKCEGESIIEEVIEQFSFPVFVKGCHMGSSVGLYKVLCKENLEEKIDEAFVYDRKVIVEEGIVGREIEFAVYGNEKTHAFPPGEVITNGEVYDYSGKYGNNGFFTLPRAELNEKQIEEGCRLAEKCYRYMGCQGMTRVDFFLDDRGKFWLNEMNPIPGFTPISLFPSICQANGMSYQAILDQLVVLGLHRHRMKSKRDVTLL